MLGWLARTRALAHYQCRSLAITNANTSGWLVNVDSAIQCDLLERTTCPTLLRSAQLKYKPSYLQLALNKYPIILPGSGYIQSEARRAVDRDQLLRRFPANWSPVVGKLGLNEAYRDWGLIVHYLLNFIDDLNKLAWWSWEYDNDIEKYNFRNDFQMDLGKWWELIPLSNGPKEINFSWQN